MIRLGKLTDYGLVLMTHMAQNHDRLLHTTRTWPSSHGCLYRQ